MRLADGPNAPDWIDVPESQRATLDEVKAFDDRQGFSKQTRRKHQRGFERGSTRYGHWCSAATVSAYDRTRYQPCGNSRAAAFEWSPFRAMFESFRCLYHATEAHRRDYEGVVLAIAESERAAAAERKAKRDAHMAAKTTVLRWQNPKTAQYVEQRLIQILHLIVAQLSPTTRTDVGARYEWLVAPY